MGGMDPRGDHASDGEEVFRAGDSSWGEVATDA